MAADLKCKSMDKAFSERFGLKISTNWNIFAGSSGAYVTSSEDGRELTKEQCAWLDGWSDRTLA